MNKLSAVVSLLFLLIYTMPVQAQQCSCNPDQGNSYWHIGYQGSRKVSNCGSSIACYNCHGFVMSYFENGCQPGLYTTYSSPYPCPTVQGIKGDLTWRNNFKYLKVCNEGDADIVFYDIQDVPGGHSAVKVGTENNVSRYISKYGYDGPLVNHTLTGSFYHATNQVITSTPIEFYVYTGDITGNGVTNGSVNIVGTNNRTFSVLNKPGVTYSWFVSGGNAIISGSFNQNTVTVTPTHSGTTTLTLRTSSPCSGTYKQQQLTLNIQTNICLEGTLTDAAGSKNLYTHNNVPTGSVTVNVTCPNASSYVWQRTSGSISYYTSGSHLSFTMPSGGSVSFNVKAKNGSTVLASRDISFINYGSFLVYPNPVDESFQIAVTENEYFTVIIYDEHKNSLKKEEKYRPDSFIDVSDLLPGNYFVEVIQDNKTRHQQRVQINR